MRNIEGTTLEESSTEIYGQPKGRMRDSKKFIVVLVTAGILLFSLVAGMVGSKFGMSIDGLGALLPILGSVFPAYIGGNVYQKSVAIKQNGGRSK